MHTDTTTWTLSDESGIFTTVEASSADDALDSIEPLDIYDYDPEASATVWTTITARCEETGETERRSYTLDPPEPDCDGDHEHHWVDQDDARGNGGGVVYSSRCSHCGLVRTTDTWAQRRDTGEQGLTSVSYGREDDHDHDADDAEARAEYDV